MKDQHALTVSVNKDTVICMSLASRPSNFATRFHIFLYNATPLAWLVMVLSTFDANVERYALDT